MSSPHCACTRPSVRISATPVLAHDLRERRHQRAGGRAVFICAAAQAGAASASKRLRSKMGRIEGAHERAKARVKSSDDADQPVLRLVRLRADGARGARALHLAHHERRRQRARSRTTAATNFQFR